MRRPASLRVAPLSRFGAEITGISLRASLPNGAVAALVRQALDEQGMRTIDSVDQMSEHVLYKTQQELEALIGTEAVRKLLEIPLHLESARESAAAADGRHTSAAGSVRYELFDCFLRRYSADTPGDQLLSSFHADSAALTINVALTSDESVEGGRLLGVYDRAVRTIGRAEGDATAHSSSLLHGVTRMHKGTRYSMILFLSRTER